MPQYYLIDFQDGTREKIEDVKSFYNRYCEIKKNNELKLVYRWCSVDSYHHITPLSSYGLTQLFLRAVEPETGGYVVYQMMHEKEHYKTEGGVTKNLKHAIILSKKEAEHIIRCNHRYAGMKMCSIEERDNGIFNLC